MKKLPAVLATILVSSAIIIAAPIEWRIEDGGNGHYYEVVLVADDINWTDAKTAAENRTHLGVFGHLATITSEAENGFVTNDIMAGNIGVAWGGGYQPPNSDEPDGGWRWVTDEPWIYENWRSGEPNNNGDENALELYASDTWAPGTWNDHSDTGYNDGYIVEHVPEPATLSLFVLGGLAVLRKRRRR